MSSDLFYQQQIIDMIEELRDLCDESCVVLDYKIYVHIKGVLDFNCQIGRSV